MIYLAAVLLSVVACTAYIAISRSLGFVVPVVDWLALAVCALLPLVSRRVRAVSRPGLAVLVLGIAVLLFFWFFWIISVLFQEGL
ncbi:MAG: hypothetical protein HONDAALG_03475 [Gammaproteobacteria bacterium]|nr:hypothetical protein [Gammaproteobacteria bacterium]